jgi:serine-type D-Ala-D-Ala carboxypeptidase (penicillin-binding protein 5/6)
MTQSTTLWARALPLAFSLGALAAFSVTTLTPSTSFAQAAPAASTASAANGPSLAAKSWLLADLTTQQVLVAQEADTRIEPASLTKLMTAYLVFVSLRDKKMTLETRPPVSEPAYKAIGSRMFVDPAKPATVEELLNGMIVQSGNDASIILAEAVAGSEAAFAELMNREGQRMGLKNTRFANSTGLPDPQHYTTARDLSVLATRLIQDFPQHYAAYYAKKSYTYNNITQENRNRLLFIDPSVDGVKTGHTDAAGYCLIASSQRDQGGVKRRLLSVVLGAQSMQTRAIESQKLLTHGFQAFDAVKLFSKGQEVGKYEVWKGTAPQVSAGYAEDLVITVPKGQGQEIKTEIERLQPLMAPIALGQKIGVVRVRIGDKVIAEHPLKAAQAVPLAGWFGRTWDSIRLMIRR